MARSFAAASSQYISVPSAASINFGANNFTVMAWVRFPTAPPDASMIIGKRAGGFDGDEGWELKFNSGTGETVRWDVETDTTGRQRAEGTATNITDGNWHLIAGERDDTGALPQIRIWYDGQVLATKVAATSGSVDTITPLVIGAAYNTPPTNYLTGEVGWVWTCQQVLSAGQHAYLWDRFSAEFLRPRPCFLMPLISRASPEPDIAGGLLGTLGNAPSVVDNPPLVRPRAPDIGQDLWYEFANATITGQSAVSPTVTRARPGAANISGQSSMVATLSVKVPVAATIVGQSTLTADISPEAPIKATIAGQSTLSASASVRAEVGAVVAAQSSLTASLSATVSAAATVASQSAVTATLSTKVPVSAAIAGQSAVVSTGDRLRGLDAQIDGQSSLTGAVTVEAGAAATVAAASSLSATLSATVSAAATVAGQSSLEARLSVNVPISTTVTSASGVAATVTRGRTSEATVNGQSNVVADITANAPAKAVIAGQSTVTATLSATVPVSADITAWSGLFVRPRYPGEPVTTSVGGRARWLDTTGGRIIR